MKRILTEPLVHFLILGGLLFAFFQLKGGGDEDAAGAAPEIVVTKGKIQNLIEQYAKVWQRAPTRIELDGLIEEHVREEVMYREALALGLDRDDTIVRRRMRQKLEFLSEDIAALVEPTDEDLAAYLKANPDSFRSEPQFTFKQVYLNADKRGDSVAADAAALRAELIAGADFSQKGDRLLVGQGFEAVAQFEVAKKFGAAFAQALLQAPIGEWTEPIGSGYGVHLVYLAERTEGIVPELAQVRAAVVRDWSNQQREKANAVFYAQLRDRYTITIEEPAVKTEEIAAK
jgi:parvulin-like peptidyl-prolyl isomerase